MVSVIDLQWLARYTVPSFRTFEVSPMDSVSVNRFRDNLKAFVEEAISNHTPLKVTRRSGEAFVVMSADDWEREQETLYVLQNSSLMRQLAESAATHTQGSGYAPKDEEVDEITRL
ncbi:type II toxin-antitoxin system Phd/YefM family antitoxin [Aliidiomarina sedimenti]|nr:type II toxin-antitoxin system Phd/YefM family antitoxin [Aliidiomarina sedimenti]